MEDNLKDAQQSRRKKLMKTIREFFERLGKKYENLWSAIMKEIGNIYTKGSKDESHNITSSPRNNEKCKKRGGSLTASSNPTGTIEEKNPINPTQSELESGKNVAKPDEKFLCQRENNSEETEKNLRLKLGGTVDKNQRYETTGKGLMKTIKNFFKPLEEIYTKGSKEESHNTTSSPRNDEKCKKGGGALTVSSNPTGTIEEKNPINPTQSELESGKNVAKPDEKLLCQGENNSEETEKNLRQELKSLTDKNQQYRENLLEKGNEIDRLKNDNKSLQEDVKNLKNDKKKLEQEQKTAKTKLDELQASHRDILDIKSDLSLLFGFLGTELTEFLWKSALQKPKPDPDKLALLCLAWNLKVMYKGHADDAFWRGCLRELLTLLAGIPWPDLQETANQWQAAIGQIMGGECLIISPAQGNLFNSNTMQQDIGAGLMEEMGINRFRQWGLQYTTNNTTKVIKALVS